LALGAISVSCTTSVVEEAVMNPEPENAPENPEEIVAEDLIEEVSIDGMCGVY
jgi:mycofactocin precursor